MDGTWSTRRFDAPSSHVLNSPVCSNTHDAFHIADQGELVCSAVVYPYTTAEVQSIARWANKHKIPIYPISMGRIVGYGGAAPLVPGVAEAKG
jgi:FAD/FMN-containing dehydrogenase